MTKVVLMGECMAELMELAPNHLQQSFAGDFFNTAVYLKRAFPAIDTCLLTAIGRDSLSDRMLEFFSSEYLNGEFVCRAADKVPGLYWIHTDSTGERSFTYWRENSAARQLMTLLEPEQIAHLTKAEWFFFSGISLAIIPQKDREKLWALLNKLKAAGVKIAFDPNFRARLWASEADAKDCFNQAFALTDLLLPGVDDFSQLYGFTELADIKHFLALFNIKECVIKNGPHEVVYIVESSLKSFAITPVTGVVDTTSAGDSFNGVYLGARISGLDIESSIALAAKCAGLVIQHKGAIMPADTFAQFWQLLPK